MGPSTNKTKKNRAAAAASHLYDRVRDRSRLWHAWEIVNQNASKSGSSKTKSEASHFRSRLRLGLEKIARSLHARTFAFEPQRAVAIERPGKSSRPLVVAPIANRIVQRALLDTLHEVPHIRSKLNAGFNFGGVADKGVPDAVKKVFDISKTHGFFIRTDINGFFQRVNRSDAVASLLAGINDEDFVDLATRATITELDDATRHMEQMGIFPLYEEGVAQGSCLSPLLCNVLLHPFDEQMNSRGVVTVRYIDDFILLAPSERAVRRAFESAKSWLAERGLTCYDPFNPEHSDKAAFGRMEKGADFLGCEVSTSLIRPTRKNFKSLVRKVEEAFENSLRSLKTPSKAQNDHTTFAETIVVASKTLRAWANTYGFCTDSRIFRDIDSSIGQAMSTYEMDYHRLRAGMREVDARRATGLFPLVDRKKS